jgi:hypothetical protein
MSLYVAEEKMIAVKFFVKCFNKEETLKYFILFIALFLSNCSEHYKKLDSNSKTTNRNKPPIVSKYVKVESHSDKTERLRKEHPPRWINVEKVNFREKPGIDFTIIQTLDKGDFVFVIKDSLNWTKVYHDKNQFSTSPYPTDFENFQKGWIYSELLSEEKITKLTKDEKETIRLREELLNSNIPDKYKNSIKKYGIILGMTTEMVRAAWGKPKERDRTISVYGNTEYWFYRTQMLYFENDILKSISDY